MRTRTLPDDDKSCGWYATLSPPLPARRLTTNARANCVIVGAGFTGLAAARQLAEHQPAWRVVVLEAARVGFGASGRNSGFVVDVGHYEPRLGLEGNLRLVRLGRAGLDHLRKIVRGQGIDCAWTERGRIHGAVADIGKRQLDTFCHGLDEMGEQYEWLDAAALEAITGTRHYVAAARTPGTAMVQPAALVRGLATTLPPSVELYEESPVLAMEPGPKFRIDAGEGVIVADRVLLATNGFTPALGFLKRRMFPLSTFGSLTRVLTEEEREQLGGELEWGLVPEERMGTTVRRTRDQRILIRNSTYYSANGQVTDKVRRTVRDTHVRSLRVRFPALSALEFEYTWGGVMGITLNTAQFFGRLPGIPYKIYASAAYDGVGMAMGTISGKLMADLMVGADSELLRDLQAMPRPSWIPPEPLLGIGVRLALGHLQARARGEL